MLDETARDIADVPAFGIFGVAAAMRPVLQLAHKAASNGRAVLVCGEAGTGRGRLARSIHALAGGGPDTFVPVQCGDATGEDLERRLFGPTGSLHGRKGTGRAKTHVAASSLLWKARGGTLYLADLLDASSSAQARLALLLRDRDLIGPDGSVAPFDCRVIASVAPDFESAIGEAGFRRDLYTRLAGLLIKVPPLRERRAEIPALAAFFLDRYAHAHGAPAKVLALSAATLLEALPWQGNGWELRGLVESLAQWVAADTIELADVLRSVQLDPLTRSIAVGGTLRDARRRFEHEYIHAVLQQSGGRVPEAARALGIQRTNLYRKMRSLGVAVVVGESRPHRGRVKEKNRHA